MSSDPRILNAETNDAFQTLWAERQGSLDQVQKIVLGKLTDDPQAFDDLDALLQAIQNGAFPSLTHLYLWGIAGLETMSIPTSTLKCLHVRRRFREAGEAGEAGEAEEQPGLHTLTLSGNAEGLEELIFEELPSLEHLTLPATLPAVRDLSLRGCGKLPADTWKEVARKTSALRRLDLSRCAWLTGIPSWGNDRLERIDLNGCESLEALPRKWPRPLRRLGLRGAKALKTLPPFEEGWPDFLDLAGTENLTDLGRPSGVRTLYLYGSGVLTPPASEHGRDPEDNVARRTEQFFEDIDLCGKGEVQRCKLLLLGNGAAGKTGLALALAGKDVRAESERLGTTHGVRFEVLKRNALINGAFGDIKLHLWDFGGQEIYHQTHRLFMSKGAVFVVLWNPDEESQDRDQSKKGAYQETLRPLRYWFDFIHLACPWKPRIALVCSRRKEREEGLEKRIQGSLSAKYYDPERIFYIDSWSDEEGKGDLRRLEEWISDTVGEIVTSQGLAVPSYWEIAQDYVEKMLGPEGDTEKPTLKYEKFRDGLKKKIDSTLETEKTKYAKLANVWKDGSFLDEEKGEERVRRTLEFLTNSGWIYWDPKLFEKKVIVGQKWALTGIYAVLQRKGRVRTELERKGGRFTRTELDQWLWNQEGLSEGEQRLLISFMLQAGVCFQLVAEGDSKWGESVYQTFEHLPDSSQVQWGNQCHPSDGCTKRTLKSRQLHRAHWCQLLKALGERFGISGRYSKDCFRVRNAEGQEICLEVELDRAGGLGGAISIHVFDGDQGKADARITELEKLVCSFLPADPLEVRGGAPSIKEAMGDRDDRPRLFISYAWNPQTDSEKKRRASENPVGQEYEVVVDKIVERLKEFQDRVFVMRDRDYLQDGDSIVEFMEVSKTADRVLVVLSDKFLKSWYCMFELCQATKKLMDKDRSRNDVFLFVIRDPDGTFFNEETKDSYVRYWENRDGGFPVMLQNASGSVTSGRLKRAAATFVDEDLPEIAAVANLYCIWNPEKDQDCEQVVTWVLGKLGLP